MTKYIFSIYALAVTGVVANDLSDFSNNLASDLGPLLSLFGEAITRQYLSESTSFLDYFIFSMVPIGILTTVVSVIRVCGSPSLRAFIGRAQEGEGAIEAELCTSTSRDVCELFNRGGITRVLGRPDILELVYLPQHNNPAARLQLFRRYLEDKSDDCPWKRIEDTSHKIASLLGSSDEISGGKKSVEFAPKPNLSLNVGIRRQPTWAFYTVALIGFILQASIMVFAGASVWRLGWDVKQSASEASKNYAPGIFIAGTCSLCLGMWSCAALIGQTTHELHYKRSQSSSERLYWIQPGPQVIGDQSFDPFAYSDHEDQLMTWTSSIKDFENRFQVHTLLAVLLVLLGYISQFIGLRGMNAWISIGQLAITLVMSCLRCVLRMKRLNSDNNSLSSFPDLVAGHELDWLAFEITLHDYHQGNCASEIQSNPQILSWNVTGQHEDAIEEKHTGVRKAQDSHLENPPTQNYRSLVDEKSGIASKRDCATSAHSIDYHQLFLNRVRLAHLTGHFHFDAIDPKDYQTWKDMRVNVRAKSRQLALAICQVAATVLEHQEHAIKLGVKVAIPSSFASKDQLVQVMMKPPADHMQINWSLDSAQLEAVLGLWLWSLISEGCTVMKGSKERDSFASKRSNVQMMRIIFARFEDEDGDDSDVDLEMSFWLGTQNIQYPKKSLIIPEGYRYSLSDLWTTNGEPNTLKLSTTNISPRRSEASNSFPQHFQRFCGWNLVYELPDSKPSGRIEIKAFKIDSKEYSLLDICAQDLFTTLIRSLSKFKWRDMDKTAIVESNRTIRLENSVITSLTSAFIDNHLGTYLDAATSIIPPFRKLIRPSNDDLLASLTRAANRYRQDEEWERAEVILKWACQYFSSLLPGIAHLDESSYFMRSLRTLGELYRWSLSRAVNNERHKFGQNGVQWMEKIYGDSNVIVLSYMNVTRRICEYHATHKGPQTKASNENDFISAIKERRRTDALYHLSFIKNGDFTSPLLHGALPLAARNDWDEFMDAILEMKGSPNSQDEQGRTAVSHCAELGHEAHLGRLISIGAHVDLADKRKRSPLYWASSIATKAVIRILLDTQQVDLNREDEESCSILSIAIKREDIGVTELLLKYGTDVNLPDPRGNTSLALAVKRGNAIMVEKLLENDAIIDHTNIEGATPLILAIQKQHNQIIRTLLDKGARLDISYKGLDPLWIAAQSLDYELLDLLLKRGANIESRAYNDKSLIMWALEEKHEALFQQLLKNGACIDARDEDGNTALLLALKRKQEGIVLHILKHGASVNTRNRNGDVALILAIKHGLSKIVPQLLRNGASANTLDDEDCPVLNLAVATKNTQIARDLLDGGAAIEATNRYGKTALIEAARSAYIEVVKLLLEYGAAVEATDQDGDTALIIATRLANIEVIKLLLEYGAATEATNRHGNTALIEAAESDNIEVVKLLREYGAAIEATNRYGETALMVAARSAYIEVVKLLLEYGAAIEATNRHGNTALIAAAQSADIEVVKLLLEYGAAIEATNRHGNTALIVAARLANIEVVKLLREYGAAIEATDQDGDTALIIATRLANIEVIKLLLEYGAAIEATDQDSNTALIIATRLANIEVIKLFLEYSVAIEATNRHGETALIVAARLANIEVVKLLLEYGAAIEATDQYGTTALIAAAQSADIEIVKLLLEYGAAIEATNKYGTTALIAATSRERMDVVQFLIEKGADTESTDQEGRTYRDYMPTR